MLLSAEYARRFNDGSRRLAARRCLIFLNMFIWLMVSVPCAEAQLLDQDCTVAVLNRTVQVNADGSWVLPGIPANVGQVRARATCIRNGVTIAGQSDFFTPSANGIVESI